MLSIFFPEFFCKNALKVKIVVSPSLSVSCEAAAGPGPQVTDSQRLMTRLEGGLIWVMNLIARRNPCNKKPRLSEGRGLIRRINLSY